MQTQNMPSPAATTPTPTTWQPTAEEMMVAQIVALSDRIPQNSVDMCFIHGAPIRDDSADNLLVDEISAFHKNHGRPPILLNGLTQEQCRSKTLAYDGWQSYWDRLLVNNVEEDKIDLLPASWHTAAESTALLELSRKEGYEMICIASHPHHQLRCFLTIVALMDRMEYWPKVYNVTHRGLPWMHAMKKPVLTGSGPDVEGTLKDHILGEYDRIVRYAQPPGRKPDGSPMFTRHATIPEMFTYLDRRG
jgi:hypothetical protein